MHPQEYDEEVRPYLLSVQVATAPRESLRVLACCQALIQVDGELVGDPLERAAFQAAGGQSMLAWGQGEGGVGASQLRQRMCEIGRKGEWLEVIIFSHPCLFQDLAAL